MREGQFELTDPITKRRFQNSIKTISDFPLSSYETLIKELIEAQKAGYSFDFYNPNNFLVDKDNERINIVDLEKRKIKQENELGNILYCLSGANYLPTFMEAREKEYDESVKYEVKEDFTNVLGKFIKAMQLQGVKFDKNNEFLKVLVESDYFGDFLFEKDINKRWNALKEYGVL